MDAIQAISVQIDQQELAITTSREYDVLQHRPQKKSYKENQLGDIIDVMKTEPQPDDKAGRGSMDRPMLVGAGSSQVLMPLYVWNYLCFRLVFPLVCYAPAAAICMHSLHHLRCTLVAALCLLHPALIHHLPLLYMQLRSSVEQEGTRGESLI